MSSISSISSATPASNNSSIEKQIKDLKKAITTEQQSDDDDKVKALKIAALEAQVQQLEAAANAEKSRGQKPDPNAPKKSESSSALDKFV